MNVVFFFFSMVGMLQYVEEREEMEETVCLVFFFFFFFFLNFIISYLKFWIFKMIYFKFLTLLFDFFFFKWLFWRCGLVEECSNFVGNALVQLRYIILQKYHLILSVLKYRVKGYFEEKKKSSPNRCSHLNSSIDYKNII